MESRWLFRAGLRRACWLLAGLGLAFSWGCSRERYHLQADREVYDLVAEKSNDPRWALPNYTIETDPRSRYYDVYDADRPPMPDDDPASHVYMHCVDCKQGWPHWHCNGQRCDLENPVWRDRLGEYVPITEQGEVELSVESALKLAYIHSPSYQSQLETIYLSALDVSTERFRLDTQFYGGVDAGYAHNGDLTRPGLRYNNAERRFEIAPAGDATEQNRLTVGRPAADPSLQMRRRFATAGELVVGFANSFVWEFSSGDANLTTSFANFSLIQPLLRGAGRDIAMEQLTIVERVLLGNLRAFERYRQGFYTQVAIGDSGVSGPSRRGGFLGGTGLTGFSGTGSGGLGGVGEATGFGRSGFSASGGGTGGGVGFAGGGAGQVGGFLGLLQQLQQIRNTRESLNQQLRTLNLLEEYRQAGVIDMVQVDQFRQSIETERATLLQAENALLQGQDTYITGTLGLPPDLPIKLDDQMIRQFQLVDAETTGLQSRIAELQGELGSLPEPPDAAAVGGFLNKLLPLRNEFQARFDAIQRDVDRMHEQTSLRERTMTEEEKRLFQQDRRLLEESLADLRRHLETLAPRLDTLQAALAAGTAQQTADQLVVWLREAYGLIGEAMLVQARPRLESIAVEPIELTPEAALQTALVNRLDLMNSRASLVDTWRLIAFNADALQSQLDIVASGDLATARNNPVSFRAPTATARVGLQFDAPFTRLLERNNYRQSLIDYQRDRRSFIQTQDGIHRNLRQLLRRLKELQVNLEIQRRAVAISIRRVDLTQEELNKPVPPPEPGQAAAQFGPTAAQNLLTALSDLRNTQNNFMSVWLNYYATRMQLLRELGIMTLDDEGRWIDLPIPELTAEQLEQLEQLETPPALPREWIDQAFQDEAGPPNPALEAPSPDSPPTPPTGVPATLPPPQTVPRSLPTIPAGPDGAAQPAPAIVPAGHAEAVSAEVGSTAFPAVPDGSEEPSRSACSSAGFVRMRR